MAERNINESEENDNIEKNSIEKGVKKQFRQMLVSINDPNFTQEIGKYDSNIYNSLSLMKAKILNGITLNISFIFGLPRPELNNLIYIINES